MQKDTQIGETGHFHRISKMRSLFGRHGDRGIIRASGVSPSSRHGERGLVKASGVSPFAGRHGDIQWQMATPQNYFSVAICFRGDLLGTNGDLIGKYSVSPFA